jgi:hypothetical protein
LAQKDKMGEITRAMQQASIVNRKSRNVVGAAMARNLPQFPIKIHLEQDFQKKSCNVKTIRAKIILKARTRGAKTS